MSNEAVVKYSDIFILTSNPGITGYASCFDSIYEDEFAYTIAKMLNHSAIKNCNWTEQKFRCDI